MRGGADAGDLDAADDAEDARGGVAEGFEYGEENAELGGPGVGVEEQRNSHPAIEGAELDDAEDQPEDA